MKRKWFYIIYAVCAVAFVLVNEFVYEFSNTEFNAILIIFVIVSIVFAEIIFRTRKGK